MARSPLRSVTQGHRLGKVELDSFSLTKTRHVPDLRLAEHVHGDATLTLVLEGGFAETYGADHIECGPGCVISKPLGARHANRYGSKGCVSLVVAVRETGDDRDLGRAVSEIRHVPGTIARPLVSRIHGEFLLGDSASRLVIDGLVRQILGLGVRRSGRSTPSGSPWLESVIEHIHTTYRSSVTISDLARSAGVHPDHLTRRFRRHTGMLVGEYVRRLRVDAAARDLRSTDRSIAEIACRNGFSDQSHLTRVFKRHTGATPGRYRSTARG